MINSNREIDRRPLESISSPQLKFSEVILDQIIYKLRGDILFTCRIPIPEHKKPNRPNLELRPLP
jgi:hypothetical protein